ncbi:MAG: DUF937 domain-containing protein [Gammaproteobacteria bacterium]|jgi:hypothetical protein
MDILNTLIASAGSGSLSNAAQARGLDSQSAQSLVQQLLPALTGQMKRNAASGSGLSDLASALSRGGHQRYLDDPAALASEEAVNDGNGILGHLLGSKDASRSLAAHAAGKTGVDVSLVKKFLPIVAAAAMGAVSKGSDGGGSGLGSLLGNLADTDGDGLDVGDLLSLGRKFL